MAYRNQCGSCGLYEYQGDGVKGYCAWYKTYYYPGDSCSHYTNGYITTALCQVLGYSENIGTLNTINEFRYNVLQKDPKYLKLLLGYDIVGPQIAEKIKNEYKETGETEMWTDVYNFYVLATTRFIREGKTEEAVTRYTEMIDTLRDYYALPTVDDMVDEYNMKHSNSLQPVKQKN